jgi:hypothetical protein
MPKVLEVDFGFFSEGTPSEEKEAKRTIARCGHVKRRLKRNEPLRGKLLDFACEVAGNGEIADKLRAGQTLTDYELHLMLDVYLLHTRLQA